MRSPGATRSGPHRASSPRPPSRASTALEAYFAGYLPQLVLAAAVPVAVLIWVVPLDPIAAVVLAITIPVLIVFMILIGKGAQARARARWQRARRC